MNRVLVAVPTAEYARRADFYDYFNQLEKPEGTAITFAHGQSPARGRNIMIEKALEHNFTHMFFVDDDVALRPNTLTKLLAHDKDIVSGLYLMRNYPHFPISFKEATEEGRCLHHFLNGKGDATEGLIEIVACGLGACLIKLDVFRNLEKPWIRLGELEKDHWCDDIGFFRRVREKGYKLYCDLSATVGHMSSVTIWPNYIDNKWLTTYESYGTGYVHTPQVGPEWRVPYHGEEPKND